MRHRGDEEPDDVEVEPLDAAGFLASAVGFQQGQVEVALPRQRRGRGTRRPDVVGATGAGQNGDPIPAVHETPCDVQQWADVPDGRQRRDQESPPSFVFPSIVISTG